MSKTCEALRSAWRVNGEHTRPGCDVRRLAEHEDLSSVTRRRECLRRDVPAAAGRGRVRSPSTREIYPMDRRQSSVDGGRIFCGRGDTCRGYALAWWAGPRPRGCTAMKMRCRYRRRLEAFDFGLAGFAQDNNVVIVGRFCTILLPCIGHSGARVFDAFDQPKPENLTSD
jgi:hypothetical protein